MFLPDGLGNADLDPDAIDPDLAVACTRLTAAGAGSARVDSRSIARVSASLIQGCIQRAGDPMP
jgi:hypothetical protein